MTQSELKAVTAPAARTIATVLSNDAIQQAVERVANVAHTLVRVLLFGSYARGNADAHSDLDLMVIETEIPDYAGEYQRLHRALGNLGVGVDLLLFTETEFERKRGWWSTPVYWAAREGKVLYERT